MQTNDLLVIRRVVLISAAHLMPSKDSSHACNSEPQNLIRQGIAREERGQDGDSHGKGGDGAAEQQQERKKVGMPVFHGMLLDGCFVGGCFALALVQSQQGQAELDVRTLGNAPSQIAHGRLLALANRRDFFLSEVAGLEVRDE